MGRLEGKRPIGRSRRRSEDNNRQEDNIKMDLMEVGCDPRDRMAIAEDWDQ